MLFLPSLCSCEREIYSLLHLGKLLPPSLCVSVLLSVVLPCVSVLLSVLHLFGLCPALCVPFVSLSLFVFVFLSSLWDSSFLYVSIFWLSGLYFSSWLSLYIFTKSLCHEVNINQIKTTNKAQSSKCGTKENIRPHMLQDWSDESLKTSAWIWFFTTLYNLHTTKKILVYVSRPGLIPGQETNPTTKRLTRGGWYPKPG